ncbi:MAG: amidohydrolase family protein [Blautia sp.]|nr:amidohydrolase family protein [Blautia sp.]
MVIDSHAHIFPEKIAGKALGKLSSIVHIDPCTDGTAPDLIRSMRKGGVDISIILPVVTDVHQFDSILRFSTYINEMYSHPDQPHRLISTGGIHPDDPDYKERLALLRREGFHALKVHPNYQGVHFNDIRFKRLLYAAAEQDMTIITHAGFDALTPKEEFCTPDMILEILREVAPEKLIAAHMGSNRNYAEAEEKLCGRNVYFDTAYVLTELSPEQFTRMVRKHGADKVLFATDTPWSSQEYGVDFIRNCPLTDAEKMRILSENAQKLFKI